MLLTGRIGGKVIVNEDINKFFDQIKDLDWTDNNIYKPAKICEVKPTFSVNARNPNQGHFQSKLGFFNQYLIEDNSNHLNDFRTYKSDVENKYIRINDKISSQKNTFLNNINLNGINDSSSKSDILEGIKNNLSQIVNNSKLKEKIGNLVIALENQSQNVNLNQGNNFNNNNNMNNNFNVNNNFGYNQQQNNFMGMNQGFNNFPNFNNNNMNMNTNMNMNNNNFGNNSFQNPNQISNQNWGNFNMPNPNNNFNFK